MHPGLTGSSLWELLAVKRGMENEMTPEERLDAAIDSVLRAAGSRLAHYTMPATLENLRDAMRKIMSQSYIDGSNAAQKAMRGQ